MGVGKEQEPPGVGVGLQKNDTLIDILSPWSFIFSLPTPTKFPTIEWQLCKRTRNEHLLSAY